MSKLVVSGVSALLSFGAAAGLIQDPKPETVERKVEVKVLRSDGAPGVAEVVTEDASEPLRSAYIILRQLRSQRLEDRPKELADRAIVLYRDGVKAFEGGDEVRARGLATASLNLARAIEVSRATGDGDPDLPPPPQGRLRVFVAGKEVGQGQTSEGDPIGVDFNIALPPVLEGEFQAEGAASVDGKATIHVVTPKIGALGGGLTTKGEVKPLIISRNGTIELNGDVKVVPKAEAKIRLQDTQKRAYVVELPKGAVASDKPIRALAGVAEGLPKDVLIQSVEGKPLESLAFRAVDAEGRARIALQQAFDRIQAAREASKSDEEAQVYLDAAKDLYNTARRDAEAGRHDRASELARAAEALARVPALLKGEGKVDDGAEESTPQAGQRIELRAIATPGEDAPRVRVERRIRVGRDASEEATSQDKPGVEKVVGIGATLESLDGKVVIRELIPGGPAASSGKLESGDRIVAVEAQGGQTVEIEGKELAEIVGLIRGEPGTKARITVSRSGEDEPRTIVLERKELKVEGHDLRGDQDVKKESEKPASDAKVLRFRVPGIEADASFRMDPEVLEKLKERAKSKGEGVQIFRIEKPKADSGEAKSKRELPPEIKD